MRMDIDRAGHDDLSGRVVGLLGSIFRRRVDDPAVADPNVADRIARVGGIDDAAAFDAAQQDAALLLATARAMLPTARATEIVSPLLVAETAPSLPAEVKRS